MEDCVEKHEVVTGAPKRSRSFDIDQSYQEKGDQLFARSSQSENGDALKCKHQRISGDDGDADSNDNSKNLVVGQSRRRSKCQKDISLRSLKNSVKRSKNGANVSSSKSYAVVSDHEKTLNLNTNCTGDGSLYDSSGSVIHASGNKVKPSVGKNTEKSSHHSGSDQQRHCLGDNLVIPKRPRGISRRKKSDSSVTLKRQVLDPSVSSQKHNIDTPCILLSDESVTTSIPSGDKHKKLLDDLQKSGSIDGKGGILVEVIATNENEESNPGKAAQRKIARNHRKRKFSTSVKHMENEGLFFKRSKESVEGSHEDEEENLEENAARMLSSRFDPSCTGFSGNKTPPKPSNGFSANSSIFDSKGSSLDDANRVLRPRRRNDKNAVRKRRHFYEVCAGDVDPFWVLNKRIKIFWPLDQIWYFGLVKDYNPATKLHHVKYDDREEEWIDLQSERFKLLMFPSEFSGNLDIRKSGIDVKQKIEGDENVADDDCASKFIETEPIISWLFRSIHRVKPSPLNMLKERRRFPANKHSSPMLLETKENMVGCTSGINSNRDSHRIALDTVVGSVNDGPTDKGREDIMDRRFSNFYYRRRFHKRRRGFNMFCRENHADWGLSDSGPQGVLEFDTTLNVVRFNYGIPDIRFSLSKMSCFVAPAESYRFFSILWWLYFGRMVLLWPKVHVEMFFLDDIMGLNILSYEGCLRQAVSLLCLILRIFHQSICCRKATKMQLPFTSVGFKFSDIQGVGRRLHFVVHYFSELGSSKWAHLHHILNKQCITRREIPFSECTYASTKSLLERSDLMPFVENMESTSLLGRHLRLLIKNDISSNISQNPSMVSAQDQENHDKLTDDSCFPATDSSCLEDVSSPDKSDNGNHSCLDTLHYQNQQVIQAEGQMLDVENKISSTSGLEWKVNIPTFHGSNTIFQSKGRHNRHYPVSPSFGHHSQPWPEDFLKDGLANGHRKPRTRVSYSSPFGGYHFGTDSQSHMTKGHPYKKARTDNAKKVTTIYGNSQRSPTSFTCEANVLVTEGDRGWRDDAAQVVLESDEHDWKILVKLFGVTKFSYKAHQFLQPGTTNRYTHAMMWKGGKNWTLEFVDRSQWVIFKEMHEECYNRNVRAASVKNIPIPGVCLIDDSDCTTEIPFVRSFTKYIRQIGTEVDTAIDPSRAIYDMDSDDEEWFSKHRSSLLNDGSELALISDDVFEKCIDMLEKYSYTQKSDEFSDAEIERLMAKFGPMDDIKPIHRHWWSKRQKKGVPLIRQFQPPLWEQYQKKLKEWESAVNKVSNSSNATQENALLIEKPPMFAFCLKPRGLEATHKGFKQRSHKKFQHNIITREQDTLQGFGRKPNGFSMGDDKTLVMVPNQDFPDSPQWLPSPSGFSPRDTVNAVVAMKSGGGLGRSHHLKLHRNSFKKAGSFSSRGDFHMSPPPLYNQRTKGTGFSSCNGFYRHADIEEFKLRDASSAAQHASNMAKLKREKAQWLLHKADLALHRAVVALMTAEAMKASEKDLTDDEGEFEQA